VEIEINKISNAIIEATTQASLSSASNISSSPSSSPSVDIFSTFSLHPFSSSKKSQILDHLTQLVNLLEENDHSKTFGRETFIQSEGEGEHVGVVEKLDVRNQMSALRIRVHTMRANLNLCEIQQREQQIPENANANTNTNANVNGSVNANANANANLGENEKNNKIFSEKDKRSLLEKVLVDLDFVLMRDPDNVNALLKRGEVLLELGSDNAALRDFNTVRKIEPNNVDALYYCASLQRKFMMSSK
jgi:tetratricopeptide (TPR) repeat protein